MRNLIEESKQRDPHNGTYTIGGVQYKEYRTLIVRVETGENKFRVYLISRSDCENNYITSTNYIVGAFGQESVRSTYKFYKNDIISFEKGIKRIQKLIN